MTLAAAMADSTSQWLTLLAGIGVGTLVTGLVTGVITIWNSNQQRQHDLNLRAQEYAHELTLEAVRDWQRLRDARLERLRKDFRDIVLIAFDIQRQIIATDFGHSKTERTTLVKTIEERFNAVRGRLLLDPDGAQIIELT